MCVMALMRLDTLTWGERIAVARRRSGLKLRDAADLVSRVMPTSFTSLARLEDLDEIPVERRRRAIAYCAVLVYGFEPSDFGLDDDDVPDVVRLKGARDLLIRARRCISAKTQSAESAVSAPLDELALAS